jgi:hypothetical protein
MATIMARVRSEHGGAAHACPVGSPIADAMLVSLIGSSATGIGFTTYSAFNNDTVPHPHQDLWGRAFETSRSR